VILSLMLAFLAGAFCLLASIQFCHMFQLEGYKPKGYFRWLGETGVQRIFYIFLLAGIFIVAAVMTAAVKMLPAGFSHFSLSWIGCILFTAAFAVLGAIYMRRFAIKNAKKPLVYTARVKRLLFTEVLLILVFSLVGSASGAAILGVMILLCPMLILLANAVNAPAECLVRRHYYNDAKKKLALHSDIIKIGITGSYGKTSTKFILGTILSEKYNVLVPPGSYNTPMGLTRVIRENLTDAHQVFLAEMGAKNVGDIYELVDMVRPKYGIITSVGPQHLESFKTIENVARAKYELIEGLPQDGCAFFVNDGALVKQMYDKTAIKKYLYAICSEQDEWDVAAKDIASGEDGSTFCIVTKDGAFSASTKLLGRNNIRNILGCVAIAKELGLTEEQITRGIAKIQPVEHRLQILPGNNGVTVIDDAFNANPEGCRIAMEVLSGFQGRKFVVTPGMVELGTVEERENFLFGERIAEAADFVFLVGPKHTLPIYQGIEQAGFNMDHVFVVNSLAEASSELGKLLRTGDVVLFENDLPDNYNE